MFLGRNIAKVTFYGKSHLFNRDAEVFSSSCLKPKPDLYGGQHSEIQQTALPLDPPQISDLQELIVKWIDGRRTFVFFHLFREKNRKPEQGGHCCRCTDLTQKMKVSTALFSSNGIISSVCVCVCVCTNIT